MPEFGIAPPAFRLPDATRLGGVRLQVADLQRSIEYYEHVLGLRTIARDGGRAQLGSVGGGEPLVTLHEKPDARPVPRQGLFGLYHFALLLPDRAALGRFLGHLSEIRAYAGSADHAVSESLYLRDPDGLGIEVYADRPRSAWRVDGQQLYMTTDPLDARGVLAAAGGETWTGMPAGTVMGHLHLHVGELERGADFYHRALGLDKVVWGYPGALFLSAGGYHHHLGTNVWSPGPSATDGDARLLSWEMVLPSPRDVDAAVASLTSAGFPARDADGARQVDDPWGTTLRLRT